jgi:hypothetical protein
LMPFLPAASAVLRTRRDITPKANHDAVILGIDGGRVRANDILSVRLALHERWPPQERPEHCT